MKCCSYLTSSSTRDRANKKWDIVKVPLVPDIYDRYDEWIQKSECGLSGWLGAGVETLRVFKTDFLKRRQDKIYNNEEFDPGSG